MEKVKPPWFPRGQSRDVGDGGMRKNKTSHHTEVPGEKAYNSINFPILGVIDTLYFADDPRNRSNAIANPKSTNVAFHDLLAKNQDEWLTRSIATTLHTGHRLEARVKVVMGPNGHVDSGTFLENVPLCISFGGAQNYGYVVPSPTSHSGRTGYRGTEDGDYCLIQFIAGNWASPIITNTWPSPLNTEDPPMVHEDVFAYARMAGTEVVINKKGDFVLDARNANEKTIVDPNDGVITKKSATGEDGIITLATRSDIYIAAGFPRKNEGTASFPAGALVMRADKDVEVFSTFNSVKIYSPNEVTDDDTGKILNLVDIQGPRGSLRKAARQYDKIRMNDGDDGEVFEFLTALRTTLEGVGQSLETSQDPAAAAAGVIIRSFASSYKPPTYQTGQITTGSDYCRIAGKGDASDVGFDENGIKDALGESVPPEELAEMKEECTASAIAAYGAQQLINQVKDKTLGPLINGLKTAEKALEKAPGGKAAADALKILTPQVAAAIQQGGGDDAKIEEANETSQEMSATSDELDILETIKNGSQTAWDWYNLGYNSVTGEYEGPTIPINPIRKDLGAAENANNPPLNPDMVVGAGWWYSTVELTDPTNLYYDPDAFTSRQSFISSAGTALAGIANEIIAGFVAVDEYATWVAAVLAAAAKLPADPEGSVKELDELTGGTISEAVNSCVNEKLE